MSLGRGQEVLKSSGRLAEAAYGLVASEYYDENLHPTCADFRRACLLYLRNLFSRESPSGRIADIGCGRSIILEIARSLQYQVDLVLVDESTEMLNSKHNEAEGVERLNIDLKVTPFGDREFNWVFGVLADPYNTPSAWRLIAQALRDGGECVFIVPSYQWARNFRANDAFEQDGFARFITASGRSVFLPSLIFDFEGQKKLIEDSGLSLVDIDQVLVGDIPRIRSPKISEALSSCDPILDIYRARNTGAGPGQARP